ncbi:MAG: CHAT domain-containing protein [Bacteroidetes bacterium]|nr:MAG: CHAT domain-containing protein [Bacteroidota bacterium]
MERANATLADILDVFQDPDYAGRIRIFHYGGHAESYQLLLESDQSAVQVAHAEGFNAFLANQSGLQVVFLNGCSSRSQALDLRAAGIPAVIGTSRAIQDDIATRFAVRFYKGLAGYATVSKAFADSVAEILTLTGPNNYRGLYLPEEPEPKSYPWELIPDPPPEWRLRTQAAAEEGEGVKIGKYAHVLCDRIQQNDEFSSIHVHNTEGKPHVYLIHGMRDERPDSLVTRFSYCHIGGKNQTIRPVEVSNWPFKGDVETLLKVRLAEHFEGLNTMGKPIGELSGSDILDMTGISGQDAIIIQHNIPAEQWNNTTANLIKWYAGKFWNVGEIGADSPHLVVFINILYSQDVKEGGFFNNLFSGAYTRTKIISELQNLTGALPQMCTLLSELEPVRRPHLDDWLTETKLRGLPESEALVSQIFEAEGQKQEAVVMNKVETALKSLIRSLQDKYVVQWV